MTRPIIAFDDGSDRIPEALSEAGIHPSSYDRETVERACWEAVRLGLLFHRVHADGKDAFGVTPEGMAASERWRARTGYYDCPELAGVRHAVVRLPTEPYSRVVPLLGAVNILTKGGHLVAEAGELRG